MRKKKKGWPNEPGRHALSSYGIETTVKDKNRPEFVEEQRKIVEKYLEGNYVDNLKETIEKLTYLYEYTTTIDLEAYQISDEEWKEIISKAKKKIKEMKKRFEEGDRWIDNDPDFWNDFKPSEWVIQTYTHNEAIERYKNAIGEEKKKDIKEIDDIED